MGCERRRKQNDLGESFYRGTIPISGGREERTPFQQGGCQLGQRPELTNHLTDVCSSFEEVRK